MFAQGHDNWGAGGEAGFLVETGKSLGPAMSLCSSLERERSPLACHSWDKIQNEAAAAGDDGHW